MDLAPATPPQTELDAGSLARTLRERTREEHTRIEALPVHRALLDARLPPGAYLAQLHAYRTLLLALETAARSGPPSGRLSDLMTPERRRAHLADQDAADLESLGVRPLPFHREPVMELAVQLRVAGPDAPEAIGTAYVLEGASLGARVQERLARQSMPELRLAHRFFAGYGAETARMWRNFVERLDALPVRRHEQEHVLRGARQTFGALYATFASIPVGT